MANNDVCTVQFQPGGARVNAPAGTLIIDAARQAGIDLNIPCGGQGRCGRCAVVVRGANGADPIRRRSTLRLSADDIAAGYALACQTVVTGDAEITIPPQESIARILTSDKTARAIELPFVYDPSRQPLRSTFLSLSPPSLDDQTDDWSRVQAALRRETGWENGFAIDLPTLRKLGPVLRAADWEVTATVEWDTWDRPTGPPRVVDVQAGDRTSHLWSAALDIGTTTVTLYLVDLVSGRVVAQAADYNGQIRRGEDVISRIVYASKRVREQNEALPSPQPSPRWGEGAGGGLPSPRWSEGAGGGLPSPRWSEGAGGGLPSPRWSEGAGGKLPSPSEGEGLGVRVRPTPTDSPLLDLQHLVLDTINGLIAQVCEFRKIEPQQIVKVVVAGNPTMQHLFLGLPPASIRLAPYVPAANHYPTTRAGELGLDLCPQATVDCLPGVASYVGADISSGVLGSGLCEIAEKNAQAGLPTEPLLFLDIGTNGEMVLGDCDWLVTCACSAGPAFEGAGVYHGMRATLGAIEEVWINAQTFEPTISTIGQEQGERPRGLCGSGLISLLAEMFITGVIDKSGNLDFGLYDAARLATLRELPTFRGPRVRQGEHGGEYVVVWADESATGGDIVITAVDIDNLLRAKAAIYAGCAVLAQSVGMSMDMISTVLVGGSFGKHINVEKSVQLGLLPDVPWENFQFLGNTSVRGAYMALLDREARQRVAELARSMTYLELSADNSFYDQFTSALFLPHTDIELFPSVKALLEDDRVTR